MWRMQWQLALMVRRIAILAITLAGKAKTKRESTGILATCYKIRQEI
jgi:hypothetical protein